MKDAMIVETWEIRDVCYACCIGYDDFRGWIQRREFVPTFSTKQGRERKFNWLDIAVAASMVDMMPLCMSRDMRGIMGREIRRDLEVRGGIYQERDLYAFQVCYHDDDINRLDTRHGMIDGSELWQVLEPTPRWLLIVDVARAFHNAMGRLDMDRRIRA